ncbi:hypothetical protein CYMTET_15362 [Cymbomonas tetramitiformis]|uniref:Uncharacterized protein n=1 Tax=Cymbomonas tetramitiformis TaxID=36881 RepID=A0AAE0GER0_9CHLO|nr:hypothetical protein CYMTET_15362 [Cymbomonas tetramitiformis]
MEPLSETTVEGFENENFPEAAYAQGNEHTADDYTPEERAAWDAGAYNSLEYDGAAEEFVETYDEYHGEGCYSDDQ